MASDLKRTRKATENRTKRSSRRAVGLSEPYAVRRRLGEAGIQQLIAAYEAGLTTPELTHMSGISKSALLGILHKHGLAIRPKLTPDQLEEARTLRDLGLSYAAIGQRFGVYGSTVWRYLRIGTAPCAALLPGDHKSVSS